MIKPFSIYPFSQTVREFHVSRQARDRYQFDQSLFSLSGNVIFANLHAARIFAQKMNQKRDLIRYPEQVVQAGQVNAMGLIDEILHLIIDSYRQQRNPPALAKSLDWLGEHIGAAAIDRALTQFVDEFPPLSLYIHKIDPQEYLAGTTGGVSNREIALEELLMLWLANENPAFSPFNELFDDTNLKDKTAYRQIIASLHDFFDTQPPFGPENQNLIDMLRSPAIAVPNSLYGQLEFIRTRWGVLIGKYLYRLLTSLDLIKEEQKAIFLGPGPSRVYEFGGLEAEPERFSPDRDWMPNLILIAKNVYVWLDQLSRRYQRPLTHLDDIPEDELDSLRQWGVTGLWLIGLWERSPASKRIKQLRGNPEAVASAYSLFAYDIAADLGGEEAFRRLRDRAWKRGIRIASDMVPNHMGIDSRWVIEHPDWFVSLDYSPFPSYSFNGPNFSWDQRVGVYIDDHYYNNTDAAVVFKRVDFWTGQEKYIYHGNDGTSMPWNDTAQLNYLNPEVREAVIQTILHVARKSPVIRFDAAMTLAKRHYQRLWYPEPGSGGDIPSRAEHGLTKEQFDTAIPVEFWREVVDRVAQEVPDTLLLAEAFWLMEGYFVRTLGMHRVYNSAFMNMLRDEKNQEYRLVIKNTIEFDPEILKRYVNFMNNPDERTAVDQFGKGDKYFGVCTMLATLPGLPMFGHGQIEGFTEKYGMEYRRAYWNETPDQNLRERHEREIFPLLRKRYVFAEARDFLLYDFVSPEGYVNEDVFAYSNRAGEERALIIYHNRFASARGWIHRSTGYSLKTAEGSERTLVFKSLGEGLALHASGDYYTIFRDYRTGLEYIRNSRDLCDRGLYVELDAYQYHVFMDFKEVPDDEWHQYAQLASHLDGRGVPSLQEAMKEIYLQPVHTPFNELINVGQIQWLIDHRSPEGMESSETTQALDEVEAKALKLLQGIQVLAGGSGDPDEISRVMRAQTAALLELPELSKLSFKSVTKKPSSLTGVTPLGETGTASEGTLAITGRSNKVSEAVSFLLAGPEGRLPLEDGEPLVWATLYGWVITHSMGRIVTPVNSNEVSRAWIDEWLLGKLLAAALQGFGLDEVTAGRSVMLVKLMNSHQGWFRDPAGDERTSYQVLQTWLEDSDVQRFLQVNRYENILWFNKESIEELLWWLFVASCLDAATEVEPKKVFIEEIKSRYRVVNELKKAVEKSSYQVEKMLAALKAPRAPAGRKK